MTQASVQHDSSQPFCPEGDLRFWAAFGASALLVLSAGHMLGLRALYPHADAAGVDVLQRVSGVLSNCVWTALCTGAGSLAIAAVAVVRVRRPGAVLDIVSRAFACVAMADLVHMVPLYPPVLKMIFDVVAFLVCVALLGRAAFRMRMLDAAAAVSVAAGAVAALTAVAYAIVWAVLPK